VLERSPKAFAHMEEEHLRDQFLVQLNGHYEGQATGETFNAEGKTCPHRRRCERPGFTLSFLFSRRDSSREAAR